jgi:hypothetical protein
MGYPEFTSHAFLWRAFPRICVLRTLGFVMVLFVFFSTSKAGANLVQNGNFTSVTYSGSLPLSTPYFGEFGTGAGSTLTLTNWTTSGYNFVYAPNTADSGTKAAGANSGQPNQAPGEANTAAGYGNTYLWGPSNGGTGTTSGGVGTVEAAPGGGNIVAMDGVYETVAVSQSISGLTVGQAYKLTFYWAGAQQESYTGTTTEYLTVTMGSTRFVNQSYTTSTVTVASGGFSGWMQQSFYFVPTNTTRTLSFLAGGTPTGQPPFTLISNVDLEVVPDFSNWMIFAVFGTVCLLVEMRRRGFFVLGSWSVGQAA